MSVIKSMVNNPHKVNQRYRAYWDFLLQSYEGGIDYSNSLVLNSSTQAAGSMFDNIMNLFINGQRQDLRPIYGNMFQHPKELVQDYQRRVNMSYYYNFCAPIIDIYSDHLFKQPIIVNFGEIEESIRQVENNIDRQGSNIDEFRKNMADMAQVYGHCFVVVDSPSISDTDVLTRKDQIEQGAFPYLTIYSPQNVINWALDEFGFPYWVLFREVYDANKEAGQFDVKKSNECYYRLWTRTEWVLYNDDYEEQARGTHSIGEVPVVCVFDKKSKKTRNFLGISSIADISFIARDIYNASSELRQILRDQTFAFLALQGNSTDYSALDLGTGKGLIYPEGHNAPQYVSPPSDNAQTYFSHIDRQIEKIYHLAKLSAGGAGSQAKATPAVTMDQQSGVSKAWDFNQTNSSLSSKSSNLEDAEEKIWRLFAAWEGKIWTGTVEYPDEFSISSIMDDLEEAQKEANLQMGKTFNLEIRRAIIQKKFPNKPDDEIQNMVDEVSADLDKQSQSNQPKPISMADRMAALKTNTATGGQKQGAT